MSINRLAN